MINYRIFQIYYDLHSRSQCEEEFLGLDNLCNSRPDWSEYWPIRDYILSHGLQDHLYYGFFSPKFRLKTGLTSKQVIEFVGRSTADVVSFSPFFDHASFFFNIFEQGAAHHRGSGSTLRQALEFLFPNEDLYTKPMSADKTIFCNYFVARGWVWREWFQHSERIFSLCESPNATGLAAELNSSTNHDGRHHPLKVFLIERLISSLMVRKSLNIAIENYDPFRIKFSSSPLSEYIHESVVLNALKQSYCTLGHQAYLHGFFKHRIALMERYGALRMYPVWSLQN
jgi:hypothetical protein